MRKLTTNEFIIKANIIHQNKFDYSKVNYVSYKHIIEIICPIHGVFWQRPDNHLSKKYGCNLCSPTNGAKITKEFFIQKCKLQHDDKYDYSKVIFNGVKNKVIIICPIHGEFIQIAEKHFLYGCSTCAKNKPLTVNVFINRANKIHNDKFNYSLINKIKGVHFLLKIICNVHGVFRQSANNHLSGRGCKYCSIGNSSKKEQDWLDQCKVPKDTQHRNVVIYIDGLKFNVDGFYAREKVIYEFLGDFWHGHPKRFNPNSINALNKKKFSFLFQQTINRIKFFRQHGYKVFSIWESKFKRLNKLCQKY